MRLDKSKKWLDNEENKHSEQRNEKWDAINLQVRMEQRMNWQIFTLLVKECSFKQDLKWYTTHYAHSHAHNGAAVTQLVGSVPGPYVSTCQSVIGKDTEYQLAPDEKLAPCMAALPSFVCE